MFSLKVEISELYFTDKKSRENSALKINFAANLLTRIQKEIMLA